MGRGLSLFLLLKLLTVPLTTPIINSRGETWALGKIKQDIEKLISKKDMKECLSKMKEPLI